MPGTERVEITGPYGDRYDEILTPQAIDLIAALHAELGPRRSELLAARRRRQAELSGGAMLDFLPETAEIREDLHWRVAPPAAGLVDRRVEITGPTDKKMTINALNSGANVWLADFEDANTPLWDNMITGQLNLKDALDRTIDYTSAEGKDYALRPDGELATIVVRPRGWHLDEKHILIDGVRASGSLVDFALYMATSAQQADRQGQGAVLLPGQEREPPRGAAVERRVQPGPGRARHPARHDPGHRADRDDPGGVRDGGDPLRAAGALGRAERRALGLPVQHHQEVPHPGQGVRAARAELGHHDRAVHARLHRAPGQDLPPARGARDRRHGRVHPEPARPRGQRAGHGQGAGRQDPRVRRRLRRLLGGAPGPGAAVQGGLRRRPRRQPEPARQAARGRARHAPRTCSR